MVTELDDVDRGILHLLQENARNLTPVDMAKQLPVSEGTVRNRIEQLEETGVIKGYVPLLDYEAAGFQLKVVFECTGALERQTELVDACLNLQRVVNVQELIASHSNIRVVGVVTTLDEILDLARELTELGLTVETQTLMRREQVRPFNHFGSTLIDDA